MSTFFAVEAVIHNIFLALLFFGFPVLAAVLLGRNRDRKPPKSRALRAPIHSARRARLLRRGILDARARKVPYWSPMGQKIQETHVRFGFWQEDGESVANQPRAWAYRCAYIRTEISLPAPLPPRGPSGVSRG